MAFAVFSVIVLALTVLAFVVKNGMLYSTGIICWLVETFLLWNQSWSVGNTYLPLATTLFGAIMTVVMVAATIMHYLTWSRGRRSHVPSDEEQQQSYRKTIYNITKKKDRWS